MGADSRLWRIGASQVRRYQFAPLEGESPEQGNWQDFQQALEQGYQEGWEQGFEAGKTQGETEGRQAGQESGLRDGLEQGRSQGLAQIDEQLNQLLTPMTALQQLLTESHAEQIQAQQQLIVDLVRRVAQQVIRCELSLQPLQIIALVEETLQALPKDASDIKIHLEPSTIKQLQHLAADKVADWHLVADDSLSQGSCRVVCDQCDADASMETRLNNCMDQVEAHLNDDLIPEAEATVASNED
ncbi:flagellar assembly protein FliH [Shewanella sp. Iso12]|uniref:flagellar assembly protein FliH n=1 Tax=Shewanella sp. Iso12 TaxID=1826753 RepID=UPI00142F87A5|nr:flagellar assembly protein FliH [Shewanella sp. Iso12]NJI84227.1 flagellar assembly protein H [Shewanella sp. Iso12]